MTNTGKQATLTHELLAGPVWRENHQSYRELTHSPHTTRRPPPKYSDALLVKLAQDPLLLDVAVDALTNPGDFSDVLDVVTNQRSITGQALRAFAVCALTVAASDQQLSTALLPLAVASQLAGDAAVALSLARQVPARQREHWLSDLDKVVKARPDAQELLTALKHHPRERTETVPSGAATPPILENQP